MTMVIAIVFLGFLCSYVSASQYNFRTYLLQNTGRSEFNACTSALNEQFSWDYSVGSVIPFDEIFCLYPPATGSLFLCSAALHSTNDSSVIRPVFEFMADFCLDYSAEKRNWTYYSDQYTNATSYYVSNTNILNDAAPLYFPTLPSNFSNVLYNYHGYNNYYFNEDSGTWFSVGICAYFLLLIVIGTIHNGIRRTRLGVFLNRSLFSKYIQSYITFPALFPNGSYSKPVGPTWFSSMFPNRIQYITEIGLFVLQVSFYAASKHQNPNIFESSLYAWRIGLADRTGVMALGKLPLIVLFAGRNNFICWLTGWPYMTLIQYHKILARWMFLDALIHGISYSMTNSEYYAKPEPENGYYAFGVLSLIFVGVILLLAMHVSRRHFYEYFLIAHVVLAVVFLAMIWWHCNLLGYCEWIIAACCVWAFDRIFRVARMIAFGYRTANISIIGDKLFKVEVTKPAWWVHSPGQYGFIYFSSWIFWENHPFSIVVEGDKLVMHIRVKKGVTSRIWKNILTSNGSLSCKVCIEGPYGGMNSYSAERYDDVLMVAGGAGIPGILDCAITLGKGKVIWIVRELKEVCSYSGILKLVHGVRVEIYVSREEGIEKELSIESMLEMFEFDTSSSSEISSAPSAPSAPVLDNIEKNVFRGNILVKYGRPNIGEMVRGEVEEVSGNNLSILACGPPELMDTLRHAVSKEVLESSKSIDYFDEFQSW